MGEGGRNRLFWFLKNLNEDEEKYPPKNSNLSKRSEKWKEYNPIAVAAFKLWSDPWYEDLLSVGILFMLMKNETSTDFVVKLLSDGYESLFHLTTAPNTTPGVWISKESGV